MVKASIDSEMSLNSAIEAMKANRPLRAEEICRTHLAAHPASIGHLRLLSHALMKQNRLGEAEEKITFALSLDQDDPRLHEDLGSILSLQKRFEEAVPHLEKAVRLNPNLPLAKKKLGQALAELGRGEEADELFEEFFEQDASSGAVAIGMQHYRAGRNGEAIASLQAELKANPDNVNAMRFLALIYNREETRPDDAVALLRNATKLAPDFIAAWALLADVLRKQGKFVETIEAYQAAVRLDPNNPAIWSGLGGAYASAGYAEQAVEAYDRSLTLNPHIAGVHMGYAHVLKTVGRQEEALKAYREAIRLKPDFGEVYWSMANLKVFRFEEYEVKAMEEQLATGELSNLTDVHFRFALGKAYEDKKDYDKAWHYYDTGNQNNRSEVEFDSLEMTLYNQRIIDVFSEEFLAENAGLGDMSRDPIFIVGLPRSGSTLVEQILASHSMVEGTAELPVIRRIADSMGRYRMDAVEYPEAARDLSKRDWRGFGREYLDETRRYRVTDRPIFTDKMPNNFPQIGLISLILPNAKIINARRHPFDSCLGGYKQLFAKGQNFTYDMLDIAQYYKQYDETMKHWHKVLPGKVLDVHYEETVTDLEAQVRRILEHCDLPFEENCIRFHETDRAVRTASSEQVRQPIYTGALGKWRRYEKHLGIWFDVLGDIIEELPDASKNAGL